MDGKGTEVKRHLKTMRNKKKNSGCKKERSEEQRKKRVKWMDGKKEGGERKLDED